MSGSIPVAIRHAEAGDISLVISSWTASHADFLARSRVRYADHRAVVVELVQRCSVAVACDPDDPEQAFGWICWERDPSGALVVHYIYTKYPFRHLGVARALWSHINPSGEEAFCTHAGKAFNDLRASRRLVFDPFRL